VRISGYQYLSTGGRTEADPGIAICDVFVVQERQITHVEWLVVTPNVMVCGDAKRELIAKAEGAAGYERSKDGTKAK
jgi:hypothetical protein